MYFMPAVFASFAQARAACGFGLNCFGQALILGNRNAFFFHGPFVPAEDAVQAEMNEHSEASFVPPLHPPITIFNSGRSRAAIGRGLRGLGSSARWNENCGGTGSLEQTASRQKW